MAEASSPPLDDPTARGAAVAGTIAWAWVILLLAGFVVFRTGWMHAVVTGNEMSVERAAFTVANAGTLTGFQQSLAIDQYKLTGQLTILVLTIGGSLFPLIAGGIAVSRIARLPYTAMQVVRASLLAEIAATVLGGTGLWIAGEPFFAAAFQAASAFGNSGVWLGRIYEPTAAPVHLVLLPLAVLGGLGIPVLLDVIGRGRGRDALSRHSRVVLSVSAGAYLVGVLLLLMLQRVAPAGESVSRTLATSSLASINARSAGMPIQFASQFPRAVQWVLMLLMAIGASPGGTGGGLRTNTLAALAGGTRDLLRGRSPGRTAGIALLWTGLFAAVVFATLLTLLYTEPDRSADYLLFVAISAAGNVGLSHDRITIVGHGMQALTATMLLGRALPLILLWWMANTTPEAEVAVA